MAGERRRMPRGVGGGESLVRLRRAREAIVDSLGEQQSLRSMAAPARMSPYHFQRSFARVFGESPLELLTRARMEEARRLLVRTEIAVTEVCYLVGYESLGTFSTRFRERTGYSPTAYRRAVRRVFAVPDFAPYGNVPACFLSYYGVLPALPA